METLTHLLTLWPVGIAIGLLYLGGNVAKRMAQDNERDWNDRRESAQQNASALPSAPSPAGTGH